MALIPLYKVNFTKSNYSFESAGVPKTSRTIVQSLDMVVPFEKITDDNLEEFESKAWEILFREFPNFRKYGKPEGCPNGWGTIFMGREYTKLSD